ncbi:MAG: hypothetical protein JNK44_05260 [Cyclobacteriaceae bacterium]|nr:hypothetical protein [Cyclobacteriaceae bacterium]
MAKGQNIVHQYFKKQLADGLRIFVKVNPIEFTGTEITIGSSGDMHVRDLTFDEQIFDDLKEDGFDHCNPLEFNLYLSGLA